MTAGGTKIFGMNLGIDPKIIVLALIVVAGLIYYFTSGSDSPGSNSSSSVPAVAVAPTMKPISVTRAAAARRDRANRNDQQTLKLVPVDGSRGDVDPTLRLGLLARVKDVPPAAGLRNLFDAGGVMSAPDMQKIAQAPKMFPKAPLGPTPPIVANSNEPPPPAPFNIPLKYYGFVKPTAHSQDGNRGFFMDGDNILVGGEGDVLEKRFLIVALTPNTARLEDTQAKQGQELQVTPEAPSAQ